VKPVNEGSSVGVEILRDGDNRRAEIARAWRYDRRIMVEAFIPGRELTVAVMGDRPLEVTEIDTGHVFYDYDAKYADGGSRHTLPAPVHPAIRNQAMQVALRAHQALGCRGVTRADFRYDDTAGEPGRLYILEVNTQPGMTRTSLVPSRQPMSASPSPSSAPGWCGRRGMARSITAGSRAPGSRTRRELDRPSRLRLWLKRRRGLAKPAALGLLGLAALGAVGVGLYIADPAGRVQAVVENAAGIGDAAGLQLREVIVEGRRNTPRELIQAALGVERGDPMLGFSPADARARLETIAWVESAHVERRLPGTILVRLTERTPFAIWQQGGRFAVIDREGKVVTTETLDAFGPLPLVVGAGADRTAAPLYDLLSAHGEVLRTHPGPGARRRAALEPAPAQRRRRAAAGRPGSPRAEPAGGASPAPRAARPPAGRHRHAPADRLVLRQPPAPEPPPQQQRRPAGNRG
jgi:hypothetical protein